MAGLIAGPGCCSMVATARGSVLNWKTDGAVSHQDRVRITTPRLTLGDNKSDVGGFQEGLPMKEKWPGSSPSDVLQLFNDTQRRSVYRPFADFAIQELGRRSDVVPFLLKEEFRNMVAKDNTTVMENKAFASSKIRYFRVTYINSGTAMQVLNVAGFSRPEFDLPIFCADFFSTASRNIIVLDLNPLYSTNTNMVYKQQYYDDLITLANKHAEVLPWGDKLTTESMQFFSPLVLWTKALDQDLCKTLLPAFKDYLQAWLKLSDGAQPTTDPLAMARNREAQHRYLTWRATKDPGRPLLSRLYGEDLSEKYIEEYLFNGLKTLGTKSFLDYFPEYRTEEGTISKQRSMMGKSFSVRPWDKHGNPILN